MALRILILEDTPDRQDVLTSLYRNHAWVLVHTAARAVTLLHAYDFDIVSIDFNLAGEATGDVVARELVRSRNADTRVVIHSMNPLGAGKLAAVLPNAVVYPVSRMVKSNAHFRALRDSIDRQGAAFTWQGVRGPDGF